MLDNNKDHNNNMKYTLSCKVYFYTFVFIPVFWNESKPSVSI